MEFSQCEIRAVVQNVIVFNTHLMSTTMTMLGDFALTDKVKSKSKFQLSLYGIWYGFFLYGVSCDAPDTCRNRFIFYSMGNSVNASSC